MLEKTGAKEEDLERLFLLERSRLIAVAQAAPSALTSKGVLEPRSPASPGSRRRRCTDPAGHLGEPASPAAGSTRGRFKAAALAVSTSVSAFRLTQVDDDECPMSPFGLPTPTRKVRATVASGHRWEENAAVVQPVTSGPDAEDIEVSLISETSGHSEAIVSLHVTHGPLALMTCSVDRRVSLWNADLESYGTLLQGHDPAFRLPRDTLAAQQEAFDEAQEILAKIGGVQVERPRSSLTVLPRLEQPRKLSRTMSTSDISEVQQALDVELAMWKSDKAAELEGMVERGAARWVKRSWHVDLAMARRLAPLSSEEARASERFTTAMEALGADPRGTYRECARSLVPGPSKHGGKDRGKVKTSLRRSPSHP